MEQLQNRIARRDSREPKARQQLLGARSRCWTVNEDSITVAGLGSLVNPFEFDRNPTGILAHPLAHARGQRWRSRLRFLRKLRSEKATFSSC